MARLTPETERFLRKAVAGLPSPKRKESQVELLAHLEDAIAHREVQGSERAQAEKQAVAALGSAEVLNRELLRVHFGNKWLLYYLVYKLSWWLPELPHIQFRPRFAIWKYASKSRRLRAQGREDEIIARFERELALRGPSADIHDELGSAYNAIGDHERALTHLHAAVELLKSDPTPRMSRGGQNVGLAGAYCSTAGVLKTLGREEEAEAAVRAGLAANDKNFLLNYWQAEFYLKRGDLNGTFNHLEASLDSDPSVVGNFDEGKALLGILSIDGFDPIRRDPRFSPLVQRAHGELASELDPMAGDSAVEAALQGTLAGEGEEFQTNYQRAKNCIEQGDIDGAFHHLEASLGDDAARSNIDKTLLLLLSSDTFNPLRKDPRFDHLIGRTIHHA